MSQENVERVKEIIEAFVSGDLRTALRDAHTGMRTHRLAPLPDPRTYRGPAGMLMAWGEWTAPYEELKLTVGELIEADHHVIAEIRQHGRRKDSGEVVDEQFWFVYTFVEGELVQQDMLASKRQALRGLAMLEDPPQL